MSPKVAIVELGSNATRLCLARVRPGVDFRVRVQTRLAAGRAPARRGHPGHRPAPTLRSQDRLWELRASR